MYYIYNIFIIYIILYLYYIIYILYHIYLLGFMHPSHGTFNVISNLKWPKNRWFRCWSVPFQVACFFGGWDSPRGSCAAAMAISGTGVLGELVVPPSPLSCCDALALLCASRSFAEALETSPGCTHTISSLVDVGLSCFGHHVLCCNVTGEASDVPLRTAWKWLRCTSGTAASGWILTWRVPLNCCRSGANCWCLCSQSSWQSTQAPAKRWVDSEKRRTSLCLPQSILYL